jgi:hypothetical protein
MDEVTLGSVGRRGLFVSIGQFFTTSIISAMVLNAIMEGFLTEVYAIAEWLASC